MHIYIAYLYWPSFYALAVEFWQLIECFHKKDMAPLYGDNNNLMCILCRAQY